ncbi:MAG: hydantoinase B/oxoprolinase family protein [Alphaproteobacteria bacterium]|nr:hydantoinase B/oxoprolinase family protein [Alphaproteobacteria bacterium]
MSEIDPITLEIMTEGLISVVREMRATVFRTARSVAIYEARDFSCGLFDATGQVVAQSEDIGSHVVPLPWSVEQSLKEIGHDLSPGDAILMNDPYRGGTHLNDVTIIYPVFHEGKLVFFPAVREHWADVGGSVPGSMSGTATEIYQEGIRIPPLKIMEGGKINNAVMELLLSNMRVRDERLGDFNSGMAACKTAERRLGELIGRYGITPLLDSVELNLQRSEARMREKISSLPDGEVYYEDYLETFGPDGLEPLLLPLKLTIKGDELTADFTGVSPQVAAPVNSTLAVTAASVFITLKSALDPKHALNHGSFRPVTVVAPEGTIVNVTHPAPAGSHGEIRKRVIACMLGALSQICPELVSADIHRTSFHNLIGGIDPKSGREYVHYEWSAGGNGGFEGADGPSVMAAIDWGDLSTAQPSEVLESRFPLRIEWTRQGIDSGGAGYNRGGLGMRREITLTRGTAAYSLLSDGAVMPPFGILTGQSGATVESFIIRDGKRIDFATPGKVGGFPMQQGDRLILQSAGGGGYGDPLDREIDRVAEDLRAGLISTGVAETLYGVVLGDQGAIDAEATVKRRVDQRSNRPTMTATATNADCYAPVGPSRKRICRLHPSDADWLGQANGDRVEMLGLSGTPLRAWVQLDEAVERGQLPLDPLGLGVLGASEGDAVIMRPLLIPVVT